jgi:hypothetical protein
MVRLKREEASLMYSCRLVYCRLSLIVLHLQLQETRRRPIPPIGKYTSPPSKLQTIQVNRLYFVVGSPVECMETPATHACSFGFSLTSPTREVSKTEQWVRIA